MGPCYRKPEIYDDAPLRIFLDLRANDKTEIEKCYTSIFGHIMIPDFGESLDVAFLSVTSFNPRVDFARYKTSEGAKCVLGAWRAPYGPMLQKIFLSGGLKEQL